MVKTATSQAEHPVRFYSEDTDLIASLCGFMIDGLAGGDSGLLALQPTHEPLVRARLKKEGVDLRRLRFLDADALAEALGDEGVNSDVFSKLVGGDLAWALESSRSGRVSVYGEIVDSFWRMGREKEAEDLERVWGGFLRRLPIRLMCGYRIDVDDRRSIRLAELHDAVMPQPELADKARRLEKAVLEVMGSQASMVRGMVHEEPRLRGLPFGLAACLWLSRHAPVIASRVRALARA